MMTPFEEIKALSADKPYLKEGITLEQLDAFAIEIEDTQTVQQLRMAQQQLFKNINEQMKKAA